MLLAVGRSKPRSVPWRRAVALRQCGSGNRARSQRTQIQPLAAIGQAIHVAQKHLDVGQQPMANKHRLGLL